MNHLGTLTEYCQSALPFESKKIFAIVSIYIITTPMSDILSLFHHIHHDSGMHSVHHCGGDHRKIDSQVNYVITHCTCGKHRIDKHVAIGHATNEFLEPVACAVTFGEKCPDGGWHVESGFVKK